MIDHRKGINSELELKVQNPCSTIPRRLEGSATIAAGSNTNLGSECRPPGIASPSSLPQVFMFHFEGYRRLAKSAGAPWVKDLTSKSLHLVMKMITERQNNMHLEAKAGRC